MTIVDSPMCLPWKASLTSSLVLFFTVWEDAQSSKTIKLFVPFANLLDRIPPRRGRRAPRTRPGLLSISTPGRFCFPKCRTHEKHVVKSAL